MCALTVTVRTWEGIDPQIAARMAEVAFYQAHAPTCPGWRVPRHLGFDAFYEAHRLSAVLAGADPTPSQWQ